MGIIKQYNFWIKLVALLILVLNILGEKLGFSVDSALFMDISSALASVLVVLGVIQVPANIKNEKLTKNNELKGDVMNEDVKQTLTEVKEILCGLSNFLGKDKLNKIAGEIDEICDEILEEEPKESLQEEYIVTRKEAEIIEEYLTEEEQQETAETTGILLEKGEQDNVLTEEQVLIMKEVIESESVEDEQKDAETEAVMDEQINMVKEKIKQLIASSLDDIILEVIG